MPAVTEVKYAEDNSIENAPKLSDEEKDSLEQRMRAMDKFLVDTGKAKYKIELLFVRSRSMWKPTRGVLTFWESGTKLHGGGDTSMKMCPGALLKVNDCKAFIPDVNIGLGHCVCPECKVVWPGESVQDSHIGNYTMRTWSEIIYMYFRRLKYNCDIYLKHAPDDIRSVAAMEQERQLGGDVLTAMRNRRALHIYPLRNIIVDTSAGSDILTRFHAFLTS
jgi:hypothetical protein